MSSASTKQTHSEKLQLQVLSGRFSVHRFAPDSPVPAAVLECDFFSITRNKNELSVVCTEDISLCSDQEESGWSCIQVAGPLDFSLTGILAALSIVLARAGISIFAVSTFDTDFILVKTERLPHAIHQLQEAGYSFDAAG